MEIATKSQAENGADNKTIMTPLRVKQSIAANAGGGGGTSDYTSLTNKPQINSITLEGNKTGAQLGLASSSDIPTKTSDLTNDSNFVVDASYTHTDNNYTTQDKNKLSGIAEGAEVNVQADWNQTNSASDDYIKNKPTIPIVPTNVSSFVNDAGYLTSYTETDPVFSSSAAASITSADINSWDNKSDFSGSYTDLTDKPTIPTRTSDLTNDSGFITQEIDPIYSASAASGITSSDITSWTNKQDALVSGTNIKTINNQSILGSGNLNVDTSVHTYNRLDILAITSTSDQTYIDIMDDITNDRAFAVKSGSSTYDVVAIREDSGAISLVYLDFNAGLGSRLHRTLMSVSGTTVTATDALLTTPSDIQVNGVSVVNNLTSIVDIETKSVYDASTNKIATETDITAYHDSSKQDALVSGTNIKTINNTSILGSGNITVQGTVPANVAYKDVNNNFSTGQTINGDLSATGHVDGADFRGGSVELSYATPFIDFHHNYSSADYTSRIIESSSGVLQMKNSLIVDGELDVHNINNEMGNTNHKIVLGYSGHDSIDIYEYGGTVNLIQSQAGNNNTIATISPGGSSINTYFTVNGTIQSNGSGRYITINPGNTAYTHYSTNADVGHWFNKNVYVAGDIYKGANYDQYVPHLGGYIPDVNAGTSGSVDIGWCRICFGKVAINPTANQPTGVWVTFPASFVRNPVAIATPNTAVPYTTVRGCGVSDVSTTGMNVYLTRTNTTQTLVYWFAMGPAW